MTVGAGNTGTGGGVTMTAGASTESGALGGTVIITAGKSASSSGTGGALIMSAGDGSVSKGGSVSISSGAGVGSSSGDAALITADSGHGGTSGQLDITTGMSLGGTAGRVNIAVGSSFYGLGGDISVAAGSTFDGSSTGGSLTLEAGSAIGGVENGNINIGVKHAATVDIGRHTDDGKVIANGLVEAFSFKIGRHEHSGVKRKHLKVVTEPITVPLLYPSATFAFDVYVPKAASEDIVHVSFSKNLGRLYTTGHVLEDDKVRVTVHNPGHNVAVEQLPAGVFTITCTSYNADE
jgi:hypothetical protein